METKKLIKALGFEPKENTSETYYKKYSECNNYEIEVDFDKKKINFGKIIKSESKTTQNFSQAENWVVLECVNRLLEKGYNPEDITLEKTFKVGRGASGGRLDILVKKNGFAYLMIECKAFGAEFDKEFKNLEKSGGQLFTYFQQDNNAEVLMLYASKFDGKEVLYKNEIVKIEEHYRQAGNFEDVYDRWNKVSNSNGVFEDWVKPYLFENKKLTKKDLKPLNEDDSQKIFYQFISILRKYSVSDKPNAFNKIFNLFLAKIFDEKKRDNKELEFQWIEHKDNAIDFQVRLINLYKAGMRDFLEKEVAGIDDDDFKYFPPEKIAAQKKKWLMFNNVFAIKEVVDSDSFDDNQIVLKEVVQLLQNFQIRYPRKHQHLSDFFERLLTTGLKQEAGQFFTPPPITRFIIKSLPISKYIKEQLNKQTPELPAVIDYSVGSGHFITEIMEEYQRVIEKDIDISKLETDDAETLVNIWKIKKYDWASKYIYGIEKDYRLVKVAKVGCYFYGDGLAQVIHGDGLDSFKHSKSYRGLLKKNAEKPQFSFIVSNPPYSVSSFKGDIKNINAKEDFKLYDSLTDRSSEIECLFIERTKQLLKTDGIASIILPSSILSNTGIYTQSREIILKYFDIIAITELGSGTFMATGTNTVTLFLKRRKDDVSIKIEDALNKFFTNLQDVTINGIEKPISKYISHVWEGVKLSDYKTLLQKSPNKVIEEHDIYKTYQNKKLNCTKILDLEKEKLLYFILSYNQKVVLIKTGEKKEEKQFLGYEFSNRRGSEGIHPIQRGKTIDACTQLYDPSIFDNQEKASTYIYRAFTENKFDLEIPENLQKNVSYQNLRDMLTFDRVDFEKNISLSAKKKMNYEEVWNTLNLKFLNEVSDIKKGKTITESKTVKGSIPVIAGGKKPAYFHNTSNRKANVITVSASGAYSGFINYFETEIFASDCNTIVSNDENVISTKLLFYFLKSIQNVVYGLQRGQAQPYVYANDLAKIKIPLPPKKIQEKIVSEIEVLEKEEQNKTKEIVRLKQSYKDIINNVSKEALTLISFIAQVKGGKRIPKNFGFSINKTDFPYLRVSDFKNNSIDKSNLKHIEKEVFEKIKNYTINKNDIYISIAGTIGLVGIIPKELDGASLTENAAKIIINDFNKINQEYLLHMLKTDFAKEQVKERTKAVGVPKLALKRIDTIKIPLVSMDKQNKIVSQIENLEKKITKLENIITSIPKQKEELLKKYLE